MPKITLKFRTITKGAVLLLFVPPFIIRNHMLPTNAAPLAPLAPRFWTYNPTSKKVFENIFLNILPI